VDGSPPPIKTDTARLFTSGGSQAVRLPKAYRFEGKEVSIRKQGDQVILEQVRPKRAMPRTREEWRSRFAELDALTDEPFPEPPPQGLSGPAESL